MLRNKIKMWISKNSKIIVLSVIKVILKLLKFANLRTSYSSLSKAQ